MRLDRWRFYGLKRRTLSRNESNRMVSRSFSLLATLLGLSGAFLTSESLAAPFGLKTVSFDADPNWEAFNNRVVPTRVVTVRQDFGYNAPQNGQPGSIGGLVTRAAKPAYCGLSVGSATLQDSLTARGSFSIKSSTAGSGLFFGWFNSRQRGSSGRPINSLGLDFDGEKSGARLAVRMINSKNKSCGTFITPFIPGKYRPTPLRNDETRYDWLLQYNARANGDQGQFSFTIKSDAASHEAFESKTFTVDLPKGFKEEGATLDRFGLMNAMKPGGGMQIHFSNLTVGQQSIDLSSDPRWDSSGNRTNYENSDLGGTQNFGFSPGTSYAGGSPGEIGGKFWRGRNFGYYADTVGPLSLTNRLRAKGRVVLAVGSPDSDMCFGWFNSASRTNGAAERSNFVGIHVGGPTRIGHYFQPMVATAKGSKMAAKPAPILTPGTPFKWSFVYDPKADGGNGGIDATLAGETVHLALKPGQKREGASLDRFGMFPCSAGGSSLNVYLDDLSYSTSTENN
jgi:hypothetical protein